MPDIIQQIRDTYAENPAAALKLLPELFQAAGDGRIVELPCKVGDTVYAVNSISKNIIESTVDYITVDNGIEIMLSYEVGDFCEDCDGCPFSSWHQNAEETDYSCEGEYGQLPFKPEDFCKTVFLTREAAEAALKERKT